MRRLFAAVVIATFVASVGSVVVLAIGATNWTSVAVATLTAASTVLIIALSMALWAGSLLRRKEAIQRANPNALVFVGQRLATTQRELEQIAGRPVSLAPALLVLGVGERDFAIWGRDVSLPLVVIPRSEIQRVAVEQVFNGRSMPAIAMYINNERADSPTRFAFVPTRAGWEIWAILDEATTSALAHRITAESP